jgi:hypothetical protein
MKPIFSKYIWILCLIQIFSLFIVTGTRANITTVQPRVNQVQAVDPTLPSISEQKWLIGTIIANLFDTTGRIKKEFLSNVATWVTVDNIPYWDGTQFVNSPLRRGAGFTISDTPFYLATSQNLIFQNWTAWAGHQIFNYRIAGGGDGDMYIWLGQDTNGTRNNLNLYNLSCAGWTCNLPNIVMYADTTQLLWDVYMSGSVGIWQWISWYKVGITSPGSANTLQLSSTTWQARLNLNPAAGSVWQIDNNVWDFYLTNASTTGDMILRTNNTEWMRISSTWAIGIGTSTPSEKLTIRWNSAKLRMETAGNPTGYNLSLTTNWNAAEPFSLDYAGQKLFGSKTMVSAGPETYLASYYGISFAPQAASNPTISDVKMFLSQTGALGIGTTAPTTKLDVAWEIKYNGSRNTANLTEKVLSAPYFTNGTANLATDIRIPAIWFGGQIEVEVTWSYSYAASYGRIVKVFSVWFNPTGSIFENNSTVTQAIGNITDNVAIWNLSWDAANGVYKIPLSHLTSAGNGYTVKVRALSIYAESYGVPTDGLVMGPLYTLTALPKNYVNFVENVGMWVTLPETKLHISGIVRAGSVSATNGSTIIEGEYSGSHVLNTFGSQYSSAATTLWYGVRPKTGAAWFVSSAGNAAFTKSSLELGAWDLVFRNSPAVTVAVGSDVTMTERFRVDTNGNVITSWDLRANRLCTAGWTGCVNLPFTAASIDGGGTANYTARFTDANTLGTWALRDDGTNIGIGMAPVSTAKLSVAGDANINSLTIGRW